MLKEMIILRQAEQAKIFSADGVMDIVGVQDEHISNWLVDQIAALNVQFGGGWWVDDLKEKGEVSVMNERYMIGGNFDEDANLNVFYVMNFMTGVRSSLIRDGRGWVRHDGEALLKIQ